MNLETKLAKAFEMYKKRISESPFAKERIDKDYRDLVYVLKSVRGGRTIEEVAEEIRRPRSTVYGWLNGAFPLHLIDRRKHAKKINVKTLLKSKEFAYVLGFYQAKARHINPKEIVVKVRDNLTSELFAWNIESLFGRANKRRADGWYCVGYSSTRLMEFINEITDDNRKIPEYIWRKKHLASAYLRGFFDSRSNITYRGCKIKSSEFKRKFPVIIVTKKNSQLLSQISKLLGWFDISCLVYRSSLIVMKQKDIAQFIRQKLVSGPKHEKLSQMYQDHLQLIQIDNRGRFRRVISEICKEK